LPTADKGVNLSGHKGHPAQEASDAKKSQSVISTKAG
jgi:hypothetical protein